MSRRRGSSSTAFYRELASGTSIGHAVAQGRSALVSSPARWLESGPAARTVKLEDWFLPQLYQRGLDEPLLPADLASQQSLRQYDLFLSHNHNDSARVEALARTLSESTACASGSTNGSVAPASSSRSAPPASPTAASPSSPDRRRALKSKWVDWEINKHLELNPDADRLLPLKLERLQLPPDLDGLLWVDFTDPKQDGDNAAQLARLIRSTDAADARRRRGFRPPARQRDATNTARFRRRRRMASTAARASC
jgi:hypothetical protein